MRRGRKSFSSDREFSHSLYTKIGEKAKKMEEPEEETGSKNEQWEKKVNPKEDAIWEKDER